MLENIAEKFIILIHHPHKSRFQVSEFVKRAGIIGSVLLDLSFNGNIELEGKRLKVLTSDTNLPPAHKAILQILTNSKKIRKIKTWVSKLSRYNRKLQKGILLGLKTKGIISIENKKFLFFNYYKSKLISEETPATLVKELREIIFNNKEAGNNELALLGLVEACKLHSIVCVNREEKKLCKSKLKEIIKSDMISQSVSNFIKETQAAIMAAIVASAAGSAASN